MIKVIAMMLTLWMMLFFFLLAISKAEAQDTISVHINKAWLAWDHDGQNVDGFDIHCGILSGVYAPPTRYVGSTIRSVPVNEVIPGRGTWYCVATAYNEFGASGPSNEVSFKAGSAPNNPNNNRVESR